jgi:hypothetical protein
MGEKPITTQPNPKIAMQQAKINPQWGRTISVNTPPGMATIPEANSRVAAI